MKVVTLREFVRLPTGTIYSDFVPGVLLGGLFRKGDTISNPETDGPHGPADFFYQQLLAVIDYPSNKPALNTTPMRWGAFDHDAQFAIYDESDVAAIKEGLS